MAKSPKTDLDLQGLKLRDLRKSKHFTTDNSFFDKGWAARLKPYAAIVYECLCRHANLHTSQAFPSYQRIADLTGMSRRQAINAVRTLLDFRLIIVKSRQGRSSNVCCLLDDTCWKIPEGWTPRKPRSDKGKPNPKRKKTSEYHSPMTSEYHSPMTSEYHSPMTSEYHSPHVVNTIHPKETNKKETKKESTKKENKISSNKELWNQVLAQLEPRINRPSFNTWIRPTMLLNTHNGTWRIGVPDEVFLYWLREYYREVLQEVISIETGTKPDLEFVVNERREKQLTNP